MITHREGTRSVRQFIKCGLHIADFIHSFSGPKLRGLNENPLHFNAVQTGSRYHTNGMSQKGGYLSAGGHPNVCQQIFAMIEEMVGLPGPHDQH